MKVETILTTPPLYYLPTTMFSLTEFWDKYAVFSIILKLKTIFIIPFAKRKTGYQYFTIMSEIGFYLLQKNKKDMPLTYE